jgi:uncharacterized protein YkwD
MKKLLCFVIVLLVLGTATAASANQADDYTTTIIFTIGSPYMSVNGEERLINDEGSTPFIRNGSTLVPLRAVFEVFSIDLEWDNGRITGRKGNTEIRLTTGSRVAYRNNNRIQLDVAPFVVSGRTMVPLRFIAESLGAHVEWLPETHTIRITSTPLFMALDDVRINVGDTQESVWKALGRPDRIDPSHREFEWHVYNRDYSRFIMVGMMNGYVEVLYSNSHGFETNNAKHGDLNNLVANNPRIIVYFDSNDRYAAHAALVVSTNVENWRYTGNLSNEFIEGQLQQIFDVTNAFRVNNRKAVLVWDDVAATTARKHSQDMANRNYFNHTGLDGTQPWDRFRREGGRYSMLGENLAGGFYLSIDAFDGWVNSASHREGMLQPQTYLGVGFGHNASSTYVWYYAQIFFTH